MTIRLTNEIFTISQTVFVVYMVVHIGITINFIIYCVRKYGFAGIAKKQLIMSVLAMSISYILAEVFSFLDFEYQFLHPEPISSAIFATLKGLFFMFGMLFHFRSIWVTTSKELVPPKFHLPIKIGVVLFVILIPIAAALTVVDALANPVTSIDNLPKSRSLPQTAYGVILIMVESIFTYSFAKYVYNYKSLVVNSKNTQYRSIAVGALQLSAIVYIATTCNAIDKFVTAPWGHFFILGLYGMSVLQSYVWFQLKYKLDFATMGASSVVPRSGQTGLKSGAQAQSGVVQSIS